MDRLNSNSINPARHQMLYLTRLLSGVKLVLTTIVARLLFGFKPKYFYLTRHLSGALLVLYTYTWQTPKIKPVYTNPISRFNLVSFYKFSEANTFMSGIFCKIYKTSTCNIFIFTLKGKPIIIYC